MVDWDLVERRRSKGWDWARIASDEKVGFQADEGAGDPGRALRALYYQRRSKAKRRSSTDEGGEGDKAEEPKRHSRLAVAGYVLAPAFAIWFLLALAFPSPVGTFVPAIPWIALLLAAAGFLLAFGLLRSLERWNLPLRNATIVGVALGLVLTGAITVAAIAAGCPTLSNATSAAPVGWQKASNPMWTIGGEPALFFYGSVACPYCSASSWAVVKALQQFGTVSGIQYDRSSTTDVYPGTPEIILATLSVQSQYVAFHVAESTNDNQISSPATSSCIDQAYVSTYDSGGGIPFVAAGGIYVHTNTLVSPGQLRVDPANANSAPLTAAQVQSQVDSANGPAWNAMAAQVYMLEAMIVKLNHGLPTSVANDANVQQYLNQLG
ncbi:MAG: DUF929 domain-containing protein [Thermoplasmata archaeon]|nr:DUF929 domain-containing protein [Thermoplasmata archaeon]